jgi:urate oxidase
MTIKLASNNYGKSAVRLLRVTRTGQQHEIKDISVDIQIQGDFDTVHTKGDNSAVLPTDTMKNTVYALAAEQPVGEIENFATRLVLQVLKNNGQVSSVTVRIEEHPWGRIKADGKPHPTAFIAGCREVRTCKVIGNRDGNIIFAGVEDLLVLRTAESAFSGYIKDSYTTLAETRDRIFATIIKSEWLYVAPDASFGPCWRTIRETLLANFASHKSESVQHTLYAMAESALEACDQISEIRLSMPNKHHLVFDVSRFGMENRNEVFVPTDEPFGLIEATVRRT